MWWVAADPDVDAARRAASGARGADLPAGRPVAHQAPRHVETGSSSDRRRQAIAVVEAAGAPAQGVRRHGHERGRGCEQALGRGRHHLGRHGVGERERPAELQRVHEAARGPFEGDRRPRPRHRRARGGTAAAARHRQPTARTANPAQEAQLTTARRTQRLPSRHRRAAAPARGRDDERCGEGGPVAERGDHGERRAEAATDPGGRWVEGGCDITAPMLARWPSRLYA